MQQQLRCLGFLLVLLHLLSDGFTVAQQADAGSWGQCGGVNNCPTSLSCADAPWYGVTSCPPGSGCVRLDAFFWQCQPGSAPTPVPAATSTPPESQQQGQSKQQEQQSTAPSSIVSPYAQCGGKSGSCASPPCPDAAWAPCPRGFSCNRDNEFFWSCKPGGDTRPPATVPLKSDVSLEAGPTTSPPPGRDQQQQQQKPSSPSESQAAKDAAKKAATEVPAQQQQQQQQTEQSDKAPEAKKEEENKEEDARAKAVADVPAATAASPSPAPARRGKQQVPRQTQPDTAQQSTAPSKRTKTADAPAEAAAQQAENTTLAAADSDSANVTNASSMPVQHASNETMPMDISVNATGAVDNSTGASAAAPVEGANSTLSVSDANSTLAEQQAPGNSTAVNRGVAAQQSVSMGMEFPGVTAEEYQQQYANGTITALAEVSGVPADSISSTVQRPVAAAAAGNGSRRLLQQAGAADSLKVLYDMQTADPAATTAKLSESLANNGDAFYQALSRNGVNVRPGVSLGNLAIPPSAPPAAPQGMAEWKKIVIGVCVGYGGAMLIVLGLWLWRRKRMQRKKQQEEGQGLPKHHDHQDAARSASKGRDHDVQSGSKPTKGDVAPVHRSSETDAARYTSDQEIVPIDSATASKPSGFNSAAAAGAAAAALIPGAAVAAAVAGSSADGSQESKGKRRGGGIRLGPGGSTASWEATAEDTADGDNKRPPWRPPSARAPIPPLAPAEHHPRSFDPDSAGKRSGAPFLANLQSFADRTDSEAGGSSSAGAVAGSSSWGRLHLPLAAAVAGGAAGTAAMASARSSGPPATPQPRGLDDMQDGEEAFGTPKSFYSARSDSYHSLHSAAFQSDAASGASFRTAASRATTGSNSGRLTASLSAKEHPRAFVPTVDGDNSDSSGELRPSF